MKLVPGPHYMVFFCDCYKYEEISGVIVGGLLYECSLRNAFTSIWLYLDTTSETERLEMGDV